METHKYVVVSPDMTVDQGWLEPPDYGPCAVEVEAPSKRQAKAEAIRTREMKPWVHEARGNAVNPFTGLDVFIMHCEHGACLCWNRCKECDEELDRLMQE